MGWLLHGSYLQATAEDGTLNDVEEYLSLALGTDGFAGTFDNYRYGSSLSIIIVIAR